MDSDRPNLLTGSDEQFRRLIEEVQDYAIFILDVNGHIQTWNAGARAIKGYTRDEIIGKHFSVFYPAEAVDEGLPDRLLSEARENGRTEHEGWRVRKDNTTFWASVTITAIHDDESRIIGYAKVTRDLTERVQRERRLEQFAHAVSHDLRQPLRTVTINLELIDARVGEGIDPEVRSLLTDAVEGAKRMQQMVDGLLEYVRRETAQYTAGSTNSEAILEDAIRDLDALIREQNAEITYGDLPVVQVEAQQIHVVFLNLLENALKYRGDEPARVHVDAERTGDTVQFSVTDNGIGIGENDLTKIFALFKRSYRVEGSEGIGIGLALCKQVIEQHGGNIWVESSLGEGSTFYFTLPAAE